MIFHIFYGTKRSRKVQNTVGGLAQRWKVKCFVNTSLLLPFPLCRFASFINETLSHVSLLNSWKLFSFQAKCFSNGKFTFRMFHSVLFLRFPENFCCLRLWFFRKRFHKVELFQSTYLLWNPTGLESHIFINSQI